MSSNNIKSRLSSTLIRLVDTIEISYFSTFITFPKMID